jgi:hypothetical protein
MGSGAARDASSGGWIWLVLADLGGAVDHGNAARRLGMVYLAYGVSYMIAAVLHPVNGQARSI